MLGHDGGKQAAAGALMTSSSASLLGHLPGTILALSVALYKQNEVLVEVQNQYPCKSPIFIKILISDFQGWLDININSV